MAGSGKRGAGERILESRHLVGLFLGVVLLCGVFFTLGYVMGRTNLPAQFMLGSTGTLHTFASPAPKEKPSSATLQPRMGFLWEEG